MASEKAPLPIKVLMSTHVLVVDDDRSVVTMMKIIFENYGYTVAIAYSASEARRALAGGRFDLVLTDMKMETSTAGFEVARTARMQSYNPAIVVLTAYPMLPEAWREAGVDAVVTKPADISKLMTLVQKLVEERRDRSA
jgi:CheY-like chemotaxis protein